MKLTLKNIILEPSDGNISPRPMEQAVFVFEGKWTDYGTPWELRISVDLGDDLEEARLKAQERLKEIAQRFVDTVGQPILPLPRKPGIFGD